jgi:hypothetical protein
LISITIFNLAVDDDKKIYGQGFIFAVSEWFSTCSFVCIGMSLSLGKAEAKHFAIVILVYLIV